MRIRFLGAVTLLLCAALVASAAALEWKDFSSEDGRFKAKFPGEPQKIQQQQDTAVGKLTIHLFLAVEGTQACAVGYSDYPAGHVNNSNADDILNGCKEGVLRTYDAKVSKERKLKLDGHPGIEFVFAGTFQGNKLEATWRAYLVQNRLYQVGVLSFGQAPNAADAKRFFDSFALTK